MGYKTTADMPLAGTTVIELSRHVIAAAAGNVLGYLGARVIKVETSAGDPYRLTGKRYGLATTDKENPLYDQFNDYKEDICLDLKTEEGMAFLKKMLETADFFVTNFRDKALADMGLLYEDVKKINPRIVYGAALGYGKEGPLAGKTAFDATAFYARSGWASVTRIGDGSPGNNGAASGDSITASYLVSGLLAGYIRAMKTGEGCEVNTSLLSAGMFVQAGAAVSKQFAKTPAVKKFVDADHPGWLPTNCFFPCKDGNWYRFCTTMVERFWKPLCEAMGLEELIDDERYNNSAQQYVNRVELYAILKQRMLTKTASEWEEIFSHYDMPVERVMTPPEAVRDAQALANDYSCKVEYESRENIYLPMVPIKLSCMKAPRRRRAAAKGADTREILKDFGVSEEKAEQMLQAKEAIEYV